MATKGGKIDISRGTEVVSMDKAKFAALIEAYKAQNPVKYEQKKAALEKQLASFS